MATMDMLRRNALQGGTIGVASSLFLPAPARAFDMNAKAAAGDVLYPQSLAGKWDCSRVLTAIEGDAKAAEGAQAGWNARLERSRSK